VTWVRLRETRARRAPERRTGGMISWPAGWGWMDPAAVPPPGLFNMQRAGVLVTQHTLLQIEAVFTSLRILSNNIIKMGDLRAYTEDVDGDNIPFRRFVKNQPRVLSRTFAPGVMQYAGRQQTVWSMGLFGEAFWYVLARDRLGYPETIEVLHPAFMSVKRLEDGTLEYEYGSGVSRMRLDPADVVHIPFKSLPTALRALSPIEYVGVVGALALAALEFGERWFSQGASPSYLLTTNAKLGQDEVDRIARRFLVEHSGLQSAHLPLVLDSGMKAEKVMSTPDEAQFTTTLDYARSCVASWFGIPMSLLGDALGKSPPPPPHTHQEESLRMLQHTLSGYMVPLEEAHTRLLPEPLRACFDDSLLSRPDSQFLAQEIMTLRQTQVATINEIRVRKLHMPPLDHEMAANPIAPLASNTAPEQTPSHNSGSSDSRSDSGD